MATVSVVLSSSPSPPRVSPQKPQLFHSPALPSPLDLLGKRPVAPRRENRRSPVKGDAGAKVLNRPTIKPRKRTASILADSPHGANLCVRRHESADVFKFPGEDLTPEPAVRKRRSTKNDSGEASVKKPRGKRKADNDQSIIKTGKITKPRSSGKSKEAKGKAKVDIVEDGQPSTGFQSIDNFFVDSPEAGNIDKAIRRRITWTPPMETEPGAEGLELAGKDGQQSIKELCGAFGYRKPLATEPNESPGEQGPVEEGLKMRKRRIEVVKNGVPTAEQTPQPKKSRTKAPKKKATTITGQATAQYAAEEDVESTTPLLEYLRTQTTTLLDPEAGYSLETHVPSRRKSSPSKKPSKKDTTRSRPLLEPTKALKEMDHQGFLFGTSSQLAAENSPTMIRQLQEAILLSENAADAWRSPEISPIPRRTSSLGTVQKRNLWSAAARAKDGSLVEKEERDSPEKGDEVGAPSFPQGIREAEVQAKLPQEGAGVDDQSWVHIDDEPPSPLLDSGKEATRSRQPADVAETGIPAVIPPVTKTKKLPKKTSAATKSVTQPSASTTQGEPVQSGNAPQRPNFEGFLTAQLSKQLTSYGFKAIKNRKQMVALLEKCWDSKHKDVMPSSHVDTPTSGERTIASSKTASSAVPPAKAAVVESLDLSKNETGSVPSPPKPKRGRPKKTETSTTLPKVASKPSKPTATARSRKAPASPGPKTKKSRTTIVEEISDSDTPPTPSPPRRRSPKSSSVTTAPLPLQLSTPPQSAPNPLPNANANEEQPQPQPPTPEETALHQTRLFNDVTRAIRAQTRPSTSAPASKPCPGALTWHEKILLYDPIVLEDLAAWLNTEGLGRVGVDEEIAAWQVKAWCEERSVCCLWRENLRGKVRERF
ncbi:MAG: hypothetical protein M4579_002033 [Chaenotheca gracillima]|nr:MAG: hypothetical protein M4579_002033 [Chaenotheca gracillima]